jgi:diguanylate cyclase (GGDEF)-like protein/PAS domain S-box-containing protein
MNIRENGCFFYASLALFIAFAITFVSLSLNFNDRLAYLLSNYPSSPVIKFFINLCFLVTTGLLLISYGRWRRSENQKKDLDSAIESINPYVLMVVDSKMNIVMCNKSVKKLLDYEANEVVNNKTDSIFSDAGANSRHDMHKKIEEEGFYIGKVIGKKKSGELISLEIIAKSLRDNQGIVILLRDITERIRTKEELLSLQKAVEHMQTGVIVTNTSGKIVYSNPAGAEMHGYTAEELLGQDVRIFAQSEKTLPMSEQELSNPGRVRRDGINARKDGSTLPVRLISDIVTNSEGQTIGLITTCEDITESKKSEELIKHLAHYDALTGLPNRSLFNDLLNKELAKARRRGSLLSIMFIDLDRFKYVNETIGHSTGDLLLRDVASRLKSIMREGDIVGRLGGDEFVVLIPDLSDVQDASVIAEKIIRRLSPQYVLNGTEMYVTASIGVSIFPTTGQDKETLIKNAETAMYYAKEQGRNGYQFYNPSIDANTLKKLSLESRLRKAIERNELSLHYQPQIDLGTGRILGAEALLRWQSGDGGLIGPKQFISLAEETGLIIPIGEWALYNACKQNKFWQEAGNPLIRVSVNVSMNQFKQKSFIKKVINVLDQTGLDPNYLELEFTENIIMQNTDFTSSVLKNLKSLGILFAIDDFGTGYSSLNYLKLLPLDRLKIDQSFVRDLIADPNDKAICKAIITMAHSLNLKVIAEGVEEAAQLEYLRLFECDEAQGFLFSKPLPAEDFGTLLAMDMERVLPKF